MGGAERFEQNNILITYGRRASIQRSRKLDTYVWVDVGGCGSKNGHQKDMSFKEIRLVRAQNRLIVIGSVVNIVGGPIWAFNEHEDCHFDHVESGCTLDFGYANHLVLHPNLRQNHPP